MLDMTIGGQAATTADRFEVRNPATGEVVDTAPNATADDLDRAVVAALEAASAWSGTSDDERGAICRAVAETITANAEELAQLLTREQGKPLNGLGSRWELGGAAAWASFTAGLSLPPEILQDTNEGSRTLRDRVARNDELTPAAAQFAHGTIDRPFDASGPSHGATDELIGKRVFYKYSATEEYEHIYLNPRLYAWHFIIGVEKGLGDSDACHYYKVDDQLHLFVWREKIMPTLGVIMIDLRRGRTTGKIMGYEVADFGVLSNFQVSAVARVLNQTNYQ